MESFIRMDRRALVGAALLAAGASASLVPAKETTILDNQVTTARRWTLAPGARQELEPATVPMLFVALSRGLELTVDSGMMSETRPLRLVTYVPRGWRYRLSNTGHEPADALIIEIRSSPGGDEPQSTSSGPPPGYERELLFDNDDVIVQHVRFAPDTGEEPHRHNVDLLLIYLSPGRVEALVGQNQETTDVAAGDVTFLPREVDHAIANVGDSPLEFLGVVYR